MPVPLTGDNPFNVPLDADYLHTPDTSIPNWSENYWFVGWSPTTEAGLWLHAGRLVEDSDLLYGQTVAYLPGETLVVDRSFGRVTDHRGPTAGGLSIRCEDPHQRWRITFDGAGEHLSRTELASRMGGAGRHQPMRFDVTLTRITPVIDFMGAGAGAQSWYGSYWIQLLEMVGTLTVGDTVHQLRGPVLRDHSMGPRSIVGLGGNVFISAVFPSGLAFAALTSWDLEGRTNLHRGFVYENGVTEIIDHFEAPFRLDDTVGSPPEFVGSIVRSDGSQIQFSCEVLHGLTYSMADPAFTNINGLLDEPDAYVLTDCPARFVTEDGEVGHGLLERAQRLHAIGKPHLPELGFASDTITTEGH